MSELTAHGRRAIAEIAERQGFSEAAVVVMLDAIVRGRGSMAQFGHPEFGGTGQWMRGGMTMVSDMFNHGMKARVDSLCRELAELVSADPALLQQQPGSSQTQSQSRFPPQEKNGSGVVPADRGQSAPVADTPSGAGLFAQHREPSSSRWWPPELASPSSTGSQDGMRYAYFADARRLAVDVNGTVCVYDTADHRISGFSQQQSSGGTVSFTSQMGTVALAGLHQLPGPPAVAPPSSAGDRAGETAGVADSDAVGDRPMHTPDHEPNHPPGSGPHHPTHDTQQQAPSHRFPAADTLAVIEQLDGLRAKGILTDDEFASKKAELLARL